MLEIVAQCGEVVGGNAEALGSSAPGAVPGADDHARGNFSFPSQRGGKEDGCALRAP